MVEEKILIELSKKGDVEAFTSLLRSCENRLKNTAFTLCPEEIEDLLQETYLAAFKSIRRFRSNSSFYTWIYRIMLNIAYKKFHKKKQKETLIGKLLKKTSSHPNSSIEPHQKEIVRSAISRLPLKYKEVITLYYFEGLTLSEIAEHLKVNEGTVKSRLFNAKDALKKIIEPFE
jgi:RNA polymerase sigma-70 factor (ECF subfamily)